MSNLERKIEAYREQENLFRNEGRQGLIALCRVVNAIGYKDSMYYGQLDSKCSIGDLINFIEDNPGVVEAIYTWIGEQRISEWEEKLDEVLEDEDGEFDEEDDVNDDNED